jgi:uncharacterized protein
VANAETPEQLRARAVAHTFSPAPNLQAAIERLGFVQADPIRAPAQAQDLILRQRVPDYRAGDLERAYPSLDLEEGLLYAYGFLPRSSYQLLHPRRARRATRFEEQVLASVREAGPTHPRQLAEEHGDARVRNAWGGHSRATKLALERLHSQGLLRIARRERGVRVYEAAPSRPPPPRPSERFQALVALVAHVLAPIPEASLTSMAARLRRFVPQVRAHRPALASMLRSGALERGTIDGVDYLWPAGSAADTVEVPRTVRLLAPFDPLVWDRRRFEHLWGWAYRFEAYTPVAKRVRGYYALPLLYGREVIGWGNASVEGERLELEVGFVGRAPRERGFRRELEAERARLAAFLGVA